jgi:hypothetical protein
MHADRPCISMEARSKPLAKSANLATTFIIKKDWMEFLMFKSPLFKLGILALAFFLLGRFSVTEFGLGASKPYAPLTRADIAEALIVSLQDPHGPPARVLAEIITNERGKTSQMLARAMRTPTNPLSGGVASQLQYKNSPLSRMLKSYCKVEGGTLSCGVRDYKS